MDDERGIRAPPAGHDAGEEDLVAERHGEIVGRARNRFSRHVERALRFDSNEPPQGAAPHEPVGVLDDRDPGGLLGCDFEAPIRAEPEGHASEDGPLGSGAQPRSPEDDGRAKGRCGLLQAHAQVVAQLQGCCDAALRPDDQIRPRRPSLEALPRQVHQPAKVQRLRAFPPALFDGGVWLHQENSPRPMIGSRASARPVGDGYPCPCKGGCCSEEGGGKGQRRAATARSIQQTRKRRVGRADQGRDGRRSAQDGKLGNAGHRGLRVREEAEGDAARQIGPAGFDRQHSDAERHRSLYAPKPSGRGRPDSEERERDAKRRNGREDPSQMASGASREGGLHSPGDPCAKRESSGKAEPQAPARRFHSSTLPEDENGWDERHVREPPAAPERLRGGEEQG